MEFNRMYQLLADKRQRVRLSAVKRMAEMAETQKVGEQNAVIVCSALCDVVMCDVCSLVRRSALEVLQKLPGLNDVQRFQTISAMAIVDADPALRAAAVTALRNVELKDKTYLMNSLSKRPPLESDRNLREDSLPVRSMETGDFDVSKVQDQNFRLFSLEVFSAGVFVHCVEDEFAQVRNNCIETMVHFCRQSEEFSVAALDVFTDLLNDQVDSVRVNALRALQSVVTDRVCITNDQFHTVLALLEETSDVVRAAVHSLLENVHLNGVNQVLAAIDTLIHELARYPQDMHDVFRCLMKVGQNNPEEVSEVLLDIFRLDKRFMPVEASVQDIMYVATAIVVANAGAKKPKIFQACPNFFVPHLSYFRDKYPEYFPELDELQEDVDMESGSMSQYVEEATRDLYRRAKIVYESGDLSQCIHMISAFLKELKSAAKTLSGLEVVFHIKFLEVLNNTLMCLAGRNVEKCASNVISLSYKLEHAFFDRITVDVRVFRLIAHCMLALTKTQEPFCDLSNVVARIDKLGNPYLQPLRECFTGARELLGMTVSSLLRPPFPDFMSSGAKEFIQCKIVSNLGDIDHPVEIHPQMLFVLPLRVQFNDVPCVDELIRRMQVYVRVSIPGTNFVAHQPVIPRQKKGSGLYEMQVRLCFAGTPIPSHATPMEVRIVRMFVPDCPQVDFAVVPEMRLNGQNGEVVLCTPVNMYVYNRTES